MDAFFFSAAAFLPHGFCLAWQPGLVALHVIADLSIAVAYFSIPIAIYVFIRRRPDFAFRWTAHLFALFISLCGLSHLMAVVTLWLPVYELEGWLKVATAAASVATATLLWPLLPQLLALPSPQVLRRAGEQLAREAASRRIVEAALRRTSGDLVRAEERTADLNRSNDELERFAYIASHDLQAPLRAIDHLVGWLEEDLEPVLTEDSRHKMDLLRQRVLRLKTLLDDLLHYSRAGRILPGELVEPSALVAGVIDAIGPPPGFEIEVDLPAGPLLTAAAPLRQVFLNLIANAIKHHDRTEGRIAVTGRDRDGWVDFAVTDDGPGIPEEQRERVFEMFYTLEPRDRVAGNGMGLALVRRAISAHGGAIWIEDSPAGHGTTVRFDWPREVTGNGSA